MNIGRILGVDQDQDQDNFTRKFTKKPSKSTRLFTKSNTKNVALAAIIATAFEKLTRRKRRKIMKHMRTLYNKQRKLAKM